jgi:hypothetical protein
VEYFPSGHFVHDDEPVKEEYVPGGQSVHIDEPLVEYVPAWQS